MWYEASKLLIYNILFSCWLGLYEIMTREEMISRYAEIQECSLEQAADRIDTFVTVLSEGLENDRKVRIKYLGTFELKKFKQHQGYDFSKKKCIKIPAHNVIKFKPCTQWREELLYKDIEV